MDSEQDDAVIKLLLAELPNMSREAWGIKWAGRKGARALIERTGRTDVEEAWKAYGVQRGWLGVDDELP